MRERYLAKMLLPLRIIRVLTFYIVVLNLVLPYISSDMGLTSLGKWLFLFGQLIVCGLAIYTCLGAQGGFGSLFSITHQPLPLSYWVLVRVLQFAGMWVVYGLSSLSFWFYILLVFDIIFVALVAYDHSRFEIYQGG